MYTAWKHDDDENHLLLYAPNGKWVVSDLDEKNKNGTGGFMFSVEVGDQCPTDVKEWKVSQCKVMVLIDQ